VARPYRSRVRYCRASSLGKLRLPSSDARRIVRVRKTSCEIEIRSLAGLTSYDRLEATHLLDRLEVSRPRTRALGPVNQKDGPTFFPGCVYYRQISMGDAIDRLCSGHPPERDATTAALFRGPWLEERSTVAKLFWHDVAAPSGPAGRNRTAAANVHSGAGAIIFPMLDIRDSSTTTCSQKPSNW
jgi:hypothetical protein